MANRSVHAILSSLFDQESEQKNCPVSETGQFFLDDQKNEKLTGQLVGQETDQNHMDVPKMTIASSLAVSKGNKRNKRNNRNKK